MTNLFFGLLFLSAGTFFLVRRDSLVVLNLEAYRRWPMLRRIPILGRRHASERFHRRLIMFDAVSLLAAAALSLISWVTSR